MEEGITDEEAVRLIDSPPPVKANAQQANSDLIQTLQLDDDSSDPFTTKILNFEVSW